MTNGLFMAIVGVYIMSFGNLRDFDILVFVGATMATIGFVISWHYEDDYRYYIGKLQKEIDILKAKGTYFYPARGCGKTAEIYNIDETCSTENDDRYLKGET